MGFSAFWVIPYCEGETFTHPKNINHSQRPSYLAHGSSQCVLEIHKKSKSISQENPFLIFSQYWWNLVKSGWWRVKNQKRFNSPLRLLAARWSFTLWCNVVAKMADVPTFLVFTLPSAQFCSFWFKWLLHRAMLHTNQSNMLEITQHPKHSIPFLAPTVLYVTDSRKITFQFSLSSMPPPRHHSHFRITATESM